MWKIIDINYRLSDGVAISVIGEYRLTDNEIISRKIKEITLDEPTGTIIPFDDLTEEQVLIWFKDKFDYKALENEVINQLKTLINKRDVNLTNNRLPWR